MSRRDEHPHQMQPGEIIAGRYRIRRLLGRGGMGAVYEAEHTSLGRVVALKVLLTDGEHTVEGVQRFLREARAAAAIGHPGIVDVFDLGQPGEPPFLVMERLEGEELRERIRRGHPLPIDEVCRIGAELASAVGAAHEHDIVHRDLKPDNVFLARVGDDTRVKVLDFGIAKIVRSVDEEARLTKAGVVFGTPAYMAPEQMQGVDVDARADIYAIGAILYESLTGAPPFSGASIHELVLKVATQAAPPVSAARPDAPAALVELVAACLAKAPADRPASASELAHRLRSMDGGSRDASTRERLAMARTSRLDAVQAAPTAEAVPVRVDPVPARRGLRAFGIVVVALLGLVAGVLGFAYFVGDELEESRRLDRVDAFVASGRSELLAALVTRMRAAERAEPSPERAVQLYDDLRLYLMLTIPRARGEVNLDDDSGDEALFARTFAEDHVERTGLVDASVRRGFHGYLGAMGIEWVDLPERAWAARDAQVVREAREALRRIEPRRRAVAALAHCIPPDEEPAPLAAPAEMEPLATVPPQYRLEGFQTLRECFLETDCLRLEWWVDTEPGVEVDPASFRGPDLARTAYAEEYGDAWSHRLRSARWALPEDTSPRALRAFLSAVSSEPTMPAEALANEAFRQTDLAPMTAAPLGGSGPRRVRAQLHARFESMMTESLRARFAALGPSSSGPSVFSRYRAEIQRLLAVFVALERGAPPADYLATLADVEARVRVLVDAQPEELRPFFEEMFVPPVRLARRALDPASAPQ